MDKKLKARLLQRADTAANWTAENPVLLSKEIGFESDTGKYKIGDGQTTWDNLKAYGDNPNVFAGATSSAAGKTGLVPAPTAGEQNKFLCADGTWKKADSTVFISTSKEDNPLVWLEIEGG